MNSLADDYNDSDTIDTAVSGIVDVPYTDLFESPLMKGVLTDDEQVAFASSLIDLSEANLDDSEGIDRFSKAIIDTKIQVWNIRDESRNKERLQAKISRTSGRLQVYPFGSQPTKENTENPVSMCIQRVISAMRVNPTLSACISTREDGTFLDVRSQLPPSITQLLRFISMKLGFEIQSGVSVEKTPTLLEEYPDLQDRVISHARKNAEEHAKEAKRREFKKNLEIRLMAESRKKTLRDARDSQPEIIGVDLDHLITNGWNKIQTFLDGQFITDELLLKYGYDVTPSPEEIEEAFSKIAGAEMHSFGYENMSRMSISPDGETPLLSDTKVSFQLPEIHPNKKLKKTDIKPFPISVVFEMLYRGALDENLFIVFGDTQVPFERDYFFASQNVAALIKSDSAVFSSVLNTILHRLVNTTALKGKAASDMTNFNFRIMTVEDIKEKVSRRNPKVLLDIPLRPSRSADIGLEIDFDPENDDDARLEQFVQLREALFQKGNEKK